MRLLQICNVGSRLGGTGACVASVVSALPDWSHAVRVRGRIDPDFTATLSSADVRPLVTLTPSDWARHDLVLLHNQHADLGPIPIPSVQYVHSAGRWGGADLTVCCSSWLSRLRGRRELVLWQGVPRTAAPETDNRPIRGRILVGRLCTPTAAKWPAELVEFYRLLAGACPHADFAFVGCPSDLRKSLADACRSRAQFVAAAPDARRRLTEWDVLLYANRRLPESFGRTVAEAMRAGCIPVVDDLGGFREQLAAGGGFLCRSLDSFVQAIDTLQDPALRRATSRQAVSIADARYSLQAFRDRLLAVFSRVMG